MKTICFDLDGVVMHYDGWKGRDVFGKPNWEVIQAMQMLKVAGYRIIIWTTRNATPALKEYLARNKIPYDSINSTAHNPPGTSQKPIYHAYIDDRAIQYRGQKSEKLLRSINYLIENGAPILDEEKNGDAKPETAPAAL
jgi:hypothetical protein